MGAKPDGTFLESITNRNSYIALRDREAMRTELDWSDYQDQGMGDAYADIPKHGENFAKAVAVCIRSGVCEQPSKGVMCPSFRISGNPQLSPGGRVKMLKLALNADSEQALLADAELAAAMDLCVACKGCKRECENNVDMAAIKVEFEAQRLKSRSLSLRSRLFAYSPFLLQRQPLLAHLIRWRNRLPWLAWLGERTLGIAAAVPLPEVDPRPFAPSRVVHEPLDRPPAEAEREVVLWVDSVTSLFAPRQAEDALQVLRAAGYRVHLLHPRSRPGITLDSGRSLLSQGLVAETREVASQLLDALWPHIQAQRPIVGLEPSSLLMLRDEFKMLRLGVAAEPLARLALLFEEFVAGEIVNGRFRLPLIPLAETGPVRVHGHCHQKASGAMKSMRKALRLIPELDFGFIDASCCGMAGTFGLEAEHRIASEQMANLALIPSLQAAPEARILCNGFGCSHQIRVMTGRTPLHLVNLLAAALPPHLRACAAA